MAKRHMLQSGLLVLASLFAIDAGAWLRPRVGDAELVERSELIVVGRLKRGPIEYVLHKNNGGSLGEHHATLIVTEVLKGTCKDKRIPVVIHYGLTPTVGGQVKREGFSMDVRFGRKDYPKDRIGVYDTGAHGITSLVLDAGEDNLWFLRKRSGPRGRQPGKGNYGIVDPEDLRPLVLKDYFLIYLSDDPEPQLREYANAASKTLLNARDYLACREIQRLRKLPNVDERLRRLIAYYAAKGYGSAEREARAAIVACGAQAGPFLLKVFADQEYTEHRLDLIRIFAEIGYRAAAPELVRTLTSSNHFWCKAPLVEGRWEHGENASDRQLRSRMQREAYNSVYALLTLGDASATPAVLEAKKLWQRKGFESAHTVDLCDRFLKKFPAADQKKAGMQN